MAGKRIGGMSRQERHDALQAERDRIGESSIVPFTIRFSFLCNASIALV
jgi:hypothetical protein